MKKRDAVDALRPEAAAAKALGAKAMFLYGSTGSTARDEAEAESDVDVFIDYDAAVRFSLVELIGIKQLLERRLGVPVDVTTRDSLDPLLRARIEASAERIY